MQRKCKKCGYVKVLAAFPVVNAERGTRRHECQSCSRERHRKYYRKDPDSYKKRASNSWEQNGKPAYDRLRAEILDELGACCQCCGEMNPIFLAIDHMDNNGAEVRRKVGVGLRGLKAIRGHIRTGEVRYQVLCHNCNMGKKLNGGICPHKEGSTTIPNGSRAKRPEAHRNLKWSDEEIAEMTAQNLPPATFNKIKTG